LVKYLVEENASRPWQLKLFVQGLEDSNDLSYLAHELFKRRWKCIQWLPSKRNGYSYFTYVQIPKNLEREDFVITLYEVIKIYKYVHIFDCQQLFELISSGNYSSAQKILEYREVKLNGINIKMCNEQEVKQYYKDRIELERFWDYYFSKLTKDIKKMISSL